MDGFKTVDEKNMNKVYRTDGQSDWMNWTKSQQGKQHNQDIQKRLDKNEKNKPSFPKLGGKVVDPKDKSNYDVGNSEVQVPSAVAVRKGAKHEFIAAEEKAEREYRAEKRQKLERDIEESLNAALAPGWVELVEPDSEKKYYFNQRTGETTFTIPSIRISSSSHAEALPNMPTFIASNQFFRSRKGYIFKMGSEGLGYYKDDRSKFTVKQVTEDMKRNEISDQKDEQFFQMSEKDRIAAEMLQKASDALASYNALNLHRQGIKLPSAIIPSIQPKLDSKKENAQDPREIWQLKKDPLTRQICYVNIETKETVMKKPY